MVRSSVAVTKIAVNLTAYSTNQRHGIIAAVLNSAARQGQVDRDRGMVNCAACGKPTPIPQIDMAHVVSEANGGVAREWNLLPVDKYCNGAQGDTDMLEAVYDSRTDGPVAMTQPTNPRAWETRDVVRMPLAPIANSTI